MRCEDVQPLLSDHLDGVLTPEEATSVDGHLAACAACRAEREDLRAVVAMLHAMPAEAMPGGLLGRISSALAEEAPPEGAPMGCDEARDLLSERLEQQLASEETQELEAHLAGCGDCRLAAAQLAAVVGLLRGVPREDVPTGLTERIHAALAVAGGVAIAAEASPEAPAGIACDEADDYLAGQLAGDLDAWEARSLTSHLAACPPCVRKRDELAAVVGLLKQVPREAVPAGLAARIADAIEALPAAEQAPATVFTPVATRTKARVKWTHWASSFAGAAAACAVFLVWQLVPGAGVPRIETAAVSVKQDVAVNIGFDVDEGVEGVIFQVDLPEGLKFVDDKAQPMLAQSVSWKGSLEKGKTVVPIVVRGIRPGRYEIEAFVRKGAMKRKTTIVLPVEG